MTKHNDNNNMIEKRPLFNLPYPPLRSVGDDATSYQGNQQCHVIVIPQRDHTPGL